MSRLSDDEKRFLTDQISMLKGENERLTKRIEDYEDDTRKVLADECAPDEKHCACVPILRAENEALKEYFYAHQAVEHGLASFDLHNDAVTRLEEARDALLTGVYYEIESRTDRPTPPKPSKL